MDTHFVGGHRIVAAFADEETGGLYVASRESGDILKITEEKTEGGEDFEVFVNTGGVPNGFAFDKSGVVYICDFAHQAILTLGSADGSEEQQLTAIVKDYDGRGLKGPNSIVIDSKGMVFFTDSGPLGATTLANPKGSVFCISPDGRLLQPLAISCLAHPCGVCLSPDESVVYVCETMANRVLRFVQRPVGVFHYSVFMQFSGGLGPTGCGTDAAGNLYVARHDFASDSAVGVVSVISPDGKLISEVTAPAPELTGIVVTKDKVYVSESSTNTVFTMPTVE